MQRLIPHQPEPRPHEMTPTSPLPHADVTHSAAPPEKPAALGTLETEQLGLNIDGHAVLVDVSFTAQPGTLTAVIGPSKAARSALSHLLAGEMRPSLGEVTIGGHDVHDEFASLRTSIGLVGPYDVVHPQLTIEQALGYIAELRLPPSTSADERRRAVNHVIAELQLNSLRTIQIGKLSDEQRQRASLASELITAPSLLVVDEPVAGSDPQTMALLRRLADAGRVVVVSTASPDHVDVCDQVLLLAPQGTPAFVGPPAEIDDALRSANWEETLERAGAVQHRLSPPSPQARQTAVEPLAPPEHLGLWRQIAVAVRRQAWLLIGDQRYFIFLTILPVLFGALTLVVPGHAGLGQADPYGNGPDEALEILIVLNLGAVFMGTALAVRDLFGERRIFRREQSGGLSTPAYLTAKLTVYSLAALVQTGIITTVAVAGKGAPTKGAVLLGSPVLELYLTLAVTAVVSATVALALSSLAKYREQLLLMAVLVILLSFLFSGAAFPLAGRFGLEQVSWLLPSRWGYAASASTVDLPAVNLLATSDESWTHSAGWWLFDMAMLIALGAVCAAFLYWRLRRRAEPGTAVSETADTGLPDAGAARYGQV
ncbi:hypothetical protein A5707_08380 [Mycobacterium kyorinense]|uniref:ABC transporter domain-containing protein n=2 Tax=Mycobacterium kyorinense TaxID=487514 RepID=A0A1A2YTQ8_9MYCO|nr:hypothetical protein A5707_08380 [Mycobacterium kyorinense]